MGRPGRVTIIGVGLIGGSIGKALKERLPDTVISGYDSDRSVLEAARDAGVLDSIADDPQSACAGADLIFIATPISVIPEILNEIAPALETRTIVTDVGSTKTTIVDAAAQVLPPGVSFIGGHPMAGSEQAGFRSATAGLLKEAVYVLTPTPSTSPEAFQMLHAVLNKMGARVMALSPQKHDEVVAAVSHLPHVMAAALVNLVSTVEEGVENRLLFAAGGFRDTTRIAGGDPNLWVDICLDNREAIAQGISKFISALEEARSFIAGKDRSGLLEILESAKTRRASMSLGGEEPAQVRHLDVVVSDRPGVISQITMTFGELGINIEDIQIVHLSGERGVIKLMVQDDPNIDRAVGQLKSYDFDVIVNN